MKKLKIGPGCISCGACEFIAPEIFKVTDLSRICQGAPIGGNEHKIADAIKTCPVGAISFDEESDVDKR